MINLQCLKLNTCRSIMENLNTLSILATDVTKLKTLAEERLKKLYGLEKIWFYIEEMTKVSMLTDCL